MAIGLILHALTGILFSFFLHLLFHELGHMLGGLLSGWNFLYLQIYNIALVREERWFSLKRVVSRSFQCIMSPASLYSNPYVYNLGGCFANLILSIFGLTGVFVGEKSIVIFLYAWSLFAMGVGFLMMNGIPRVKRICNDMACHLYLKRDSVTRLCHNLQLISAKYLIKGATYRQLGEEMLNLPSDEAYNDILAYQALLEYYYFLDMDDYRGMIGALGKVKDIEKLSDSIQSCYYTELVYINLMMKIRQYQQLPMISKAGSPFVLPEALEIYNMEMFDLSKSRHTIFGIKGDLHFERLKAAYDTYRELLAGRRIRARRRLIKAIEDISNMTCIYRGEKEFCIRQLKVLLKSFSALE